MTTADEFEAEYGSPVFQSTFQAFAEGLDGNGILDFGDLLVSAGGTSNGLDVAATTRGLWYNGTVYTYAGGTDVLTLSSNTSGSDRWDLVYFDTGTTSPAVREGTPATKPDLPLLQAGEFPLAAVYVADGQTDVTDSEIRNVRVHGQAAEETWFEDAAGEFSSTTVEAAFTEVIREAGDPLNGPLDLSSFSGSAAFDLGTNPGQFGAIVDAVVDGNDAGGTEESFLFAVDSTTVLKIYAESDGAGGVQNLRAEVPQGLLTGGDVDDDRGNTLYDYAANEFSQARLGGPASSLTSYPLPIGDLNSPFSLPSITDMDANGNDLSDSAGPGTLYDASAGEFVRGVLDDEKTTTTVTSSTYSSADEELILVDTATIAAASTITLSSSDVETGSTIVVADVSGSASANPITVDTEGAETINGGASSTISTDYAARTFSSDGTNWVTTTASKLDATVQVEGAESGAVAAGEQGTLIFDHLESGETLEIYKAIFTLDDGQAVPSGFDLVIATLDNAGNYTSQTTIYSGDGSTVWDGDPANSIGDPLASYTAGSATTVAVLADNTTAGSLSVMAKATGERIP